MRPISFDSNSKDSSLLQWSKKCCPFYLIGFSLSSFWPYHQFQRNLHGYFKCVSNLQLWVDNNNVAGTYPSSFIYPSIILYHWDSYFPNVSWLIFRFTLSTTLTWLDLYLSPSGSWISTFKCNQNQPFFLDKGPNYIENSVWWTQCDSFSCFISILLSVWRLYMLPTS